MLIIVCYDIPDNKRREKLRKSLLMFGNPVQFSVFECDLTKRQIEQMTRTIRGIMSKDEDNIRYYQLCGSCVENAEIFGGKPLEKTERVYIV
jgi:CRISPR-associated protein Cas2